MTRGNHNDKSAARIERAHPGVSVFDSRGHEMRLLTGMKSRFARSAARAAERYRAPNGDSGQANGDNSRDGQTQGGGGGGVGGVECSLFNRSGSACSEREPCDTCYWHAQTRTAGT
jgi:hypothetical protein